MNTPSQSMSVPLRGLTTEILFPFLAENRNSFPALHYGLSRHILPRCAQSGIPRPSVPGLPVVHDFSRQIGKKIVAKHKQRTQI